MRKFISLLVLTLIFASCKTKQINQKVDKKPDGLWISIYTEDKDIYKTIENYKIGTPIKTWKNYQNGTLIKKEHYKNGTSKIKFYHENGKIQSRGATRSIINAKETHWFYSGKWKFYSAQGKLIQTKIYKNGELLSEENKN